MSVDVIKKTFLDSPRHTVAQHYRFVSSLASSQGKEGKREEDEKREHSRAEWVNSFMFSLTSVKWWECYWGCSSFQASLKQITVHSIYCAITRGGNRGVKVRVFVDIF